jgi:CheY-like chemotaxis protein
MIEMTDPVDQQRQPARAVERWGHTTRATPSRPLSVLIVDDNRDAADTLALFLRLHGHDARSAYGGEQAAAILGGWHADAAVLDIQMNGVDGIELAGRLRAGANGSILLVALTGLGTCDDVARVKAAPFDHVFLKPVEPEQLVRVLDVQSKGTPPKR